VAWSRNGLLLIAWLFALAWVLVFIGGTASADSPDQLTRGAQMFKIRCEPCHGDQGQGLALWRLTWAPEDQNCASHKCHGLGHPPDGFYMPKDAPPIIGTDTLIVFPSAHELYGYISKAMPFDKPGELTSDDYWAITAFLIQKHGALPTGIRVDSSNAASIPVNLGSLPPNHQSDQSILPVTGGIAALVLFALGVLFIRRRQSMHGV
jgi:mono/diheme cytochrome c family protein